MKFKVGDVIQHVKRKEKLKVIKTAEAGETVEGPWRNRRHATYYMYFDAYILEFINGDAKGCWAFMYITSENSFELVKEEDTKDEELNSIIRESLTILIEQREKELKILKDTLSNINKIL